MTKVTSLALRRLRAPLLALIAAYAVSVLGFVLIPGMDADGRPWRMDFFHALYFVSFMSTTIGFGEIPYPFTEAQRLWTTVTIFLNVTTWLYAVGTILALVQDAAFRQALTRGRFARSVARINEPFYVVCGYGDTGSLLVHALAARGRRSVVVDIDLEALQALTLDEHPVYVPGLCADAAEPRSLRVSGLANRHCAGVVAVTNDDHANLTVAITVKLLRPSLPVICRAQSRETADNMASFGTDYVVDPFQTFADRLAMAIHSPGLNLLYDWLSGVRGSELGEPLYPPRGEWVLCGYGRFGKAVRRYLDYEGIPSRIIEADPERTESPEGTIVGKGTEAVTLREARIQEAAGLVAGTDDDADNLSIIMTARELHPGLFVVARQNRRAHANLFRAARSDLVMQPAEMVARRLLSVLITPLLAQFLHLARQRRPEWANELVSRIAAVVADRVPDVWVVEVDERHAPALQDALAAGRGVALRWLLADPRDRDQPLPALPLLLTRGEEPVLDPDGETRLAPGDALLFCGETRARRAMDWALHDATVLAYLTSGRRTPDGLVWRWLARRGG